MSRFLSRPWPMRSSLSKRGRMGDMEKPVIALTMGDAAGIGPELVVKVLAQDAVYDRCCPVVIGAPQVMTEACRIVGSTLHVHAIDRLAEARFSPPDMD